MGSEGVTKAKELYLGAILSGGAGQAAGSGCGHRCPGCAEPETEEGAALSGSPATAGKERAGATDGPATEASLAGRPGPLSAPAASSPGPAALLGCSGHGAALPPGMSSRCSVPYFNVFSVDVCNV